MRLPEESSCIVSSSCSNSGEFYLSIDEAITLQKQHAGPSVEKRREKFVEIRLLCIDTIFTKSEQRCL